MRRTGALALAILALLAARGRASGDGPSEFRRGFDAILAEHRKAREPYDATWPRIEALKKAGTPQADLDRIQDEAVRRYVDAVEANTGRVLDLARAHPDDPAVPEALGFVIRTARAGPSDRSRGALQILARDHARSPGMGTLGRWTFHLFFMPEVEALSRAVLAENPIREERARACYNLAYHLRYKADLRERFRRSPAPLDDYPEPWRRPLVERFLRDEDPEADRREAEALLGRCLAEFADVRLDPDDPRPIGLIAQGELSAIRDLAIGRVAPEIRGADAEGAPFRLGDYRGKVVVLTFSGNWCGPCRGMYPQERTLLERHKAQPFAIVSVDTDKDRDVLKASIRDGEITWRCWWDGGTDGPITTAWGVSSFPTIFVLDRDSVIRFRDVRGAELDEAVRGLLGPEGEGH